MPPAAKDQFCSNVHTEVVRLLGGSEAFAEFSSQHPACNAELWGFALQHFGGRLDPRQTAAVWYAQRVAPMLEARDNPPPPETRYRQLGREDLAQAREIALCLRNQLPGYGPEELGETPEITEVVYNGQDVEDGEPPQYACQLRVGGDDHTWVLVPPYEGQTQRELAVCIANAGRVILDLLCEIETVRHANQALLAWRNGQTPTENV